MLYPENFEKKIGFDKIRELLKNKCLSDLGRGKIDKIRLSVSYKFIQSLINQVEEFVEIIDFEDNFPLNHFYDVTSYLKKIRIEGTYLLEEEIFHFKRSLETIRAIIKFFKKKNEEDKYPYLFNISHHIKLYPFIFDSIDTIITNQGRIKDNASPELQTIRRDIKHKESSIQKKLVAVLKNAQKEGIISQDTTLTVREGRAVVPVDASNKRKLKGFIMDESATGKTVYIEPEQVVELNNDLKELFYAEKREIVKILTDFSDQVRPYLDDLFLAYDFLGTIDYIRAKALLAKQIKGVKPAFQKAPTVRWMDAVHPLLFLSFLKDKKTVVPLDIVLTHDEQRILLISGPNAGGKSVCLQTVGLLQYMFQCGLLVPVRETSEFGIFHKIFIDIGDDQSIENDLSTYSSHLINMKHFLKNADNSSLVLIDEFGSGTEPLLGGAIAESILGELNKREIFGVITTHYSNLKHFASNVGGIENGAMLFDTQKIEPLFKLSIGEPGSSFAFEISRKIGLPEFILKDATGKVGKEHIDFDRSLKDIIRDKRYWEKKRDKIRKSENELEKVLEEYSLEIADIKKLRNEILTQAKNEAREKLDNVNKTIENTIREIRESQAEKEKTKKLRESLNHLKEDLDAASESEDQKIRRKMQKIKQRQNWKNKGSKPDKPEASDKKQEQKKAIEIGAKVKLTGQDAYGEVIELNGKNALVAVGNLVTSLSVDRIERVSENEYPREKSGDEQSLGDKWNFEERRMNFKPDIDVRGKRADEALEMVRDFIDEAIVINMSRVRILHGKGDGILRHLIRQYLETVDVVNNFHDESVQFGGSGITIVEFD